MWKRWRGVALAFVAALSVSTLFSARPARAQTNTYADWPYNQGSLFYRYGASGNRPPRVVAPRPARQWVAPWGPYVYQPTRRVVVPYRAPRRYYWRRGY